MTNRRTGVRHPSGAWAVLLALALAHCGGGEPEQAPPPPSPSTPGVVEADVEAEAETEAEAEEPAVGAALFGIEADDTRVRTRAFRTLLDAGFDPGELVRLVVRPSRPSWEGSALVDLLSVDPDAALPPLLHRVTHSAPVPRATICTALGDARAPAVAACALLAVRALLDPFDFVREAALDALRRLDPGMADAVVEHHRRDAVLADGSVAVLERELLVAEGCPFAEGPARRFLLQVLRAEAERFGPSTPLRVAKFGAPLPECERWVEELVGPLVEYGALGEVELELLAGLGTSIVPLLREHLRSPDVRAPAVTAVGLMGPDAAAALPELLPLAVEPHPLWRDAVVAIARVAPGDVYAAKELFPLLTLEETRAHAAWALGEMGVAVPSVVDRLCQHVQGLLGTGEDAAQAEGALTRLVSAGHGVEEVTALLEHDDSMVVWTALRVLALCSESVRDATRSRILDVATSAGERPTRRAAVQALALLDRTEEEREAERSRRTAALTREVLNRRTGVRHPSGD